MFLLSREGWIEEVDVVDELESVSWFCDVDSFPRTNRFGEEFLHANHSMEREMNKAESKL